MPSPLATRAETVHGTAPPMVDQRPLPVREKMILGLLLLLSLTSTVSAGAFVVNVTQTSHQAEEDHNITLEWTFTPRADGSLRDLNIYCELLTKDRDSVLFHLHEGVEVPETQDEQFKGRVQCDKDVLREGRLRLHVSRLSINDSGPYRCEVFTSYGWGIRRIRLNVTAAESKPERPTERPQPESQIYIFIFIISILIISILVVVFAFALVLVLICVLIVQKTKKCRFS